MKYEDYAVLKERIVPQLRYNQSIYEDILSAYVTGQIWLDAGCGMHILPPWRQEAERALVQKAALAVGCDADQVSIRNHHTLNRLVVADLEHLPFKAESVSLITCNMVVEHLDRPLSVFSEYARVLKRNGRVILHTPNVYSHFVLASRFIPRRLKLRLVKALDGRAQSEVFPTRYRANRAGRLRKLMVQVGLQEEKCWLLTTDATLQVTHPLLAALELLYIRLTLKSAFKLLRASILAIFGKHSREDIPALLCRSGGNAKSVVSENQGTR